MTPAPGFNRRLRAALKANGIAEEALPQIAPVTPERARELLQMEVGDTVKAATLFRVSDVTGFSSRWLLYGSGPVSKRYPIDPDDVWALEALLAVSENDRAAIAAALAAMKARA